MKKLFTIAGILISIPMLGQICSTTTFAKRIGGVGDDRGNGVVSTKDGGFAIVGTTTTGSAGAKDFLLCKFDQYGNSEWCRNYGGTGNEWGQTVYLMECYDGGYLITSTSVGGGSNEATVIKVKQDGSQEWVRYFGFSGDDLFRSAAQTPDSGYVLAGNYNAGGSGFGMIDVAVLKLDKSGNTIWHKIFGNNKEEWTNNIRVFDNGEIIITINGNKSINSKGASGLIKLDASGNVIYQKKYNIPAGIGFQSGEITSDNKLIIAGVYVSGGVGSSYAAKLNPDGTIIWDKWFANTSSSKHIVEDADGNYLMVCTYDSSGLGTSDFLVVKMDPSGTVLETNRYGMKSSNEKTDNWGHCIAAMPDGGFIITGFTDVNGDNDVFYAKANKCAEVGCITEAFNLTENVSILVDSVLSISSGILGSASPAVLTTNTPLFSTDTICYYDAAFSSITVLTCGSYTSPSGKEWVDSGLYEDTITGPTGGDSIIIINLTVNSIPTPTITANGTTLSTEAASSYQWYLNGIAIAGATSQTYNATENGSYTVEVTDGNGCSGTSETQEVTEIIGIKEHSSNQISVFPNPGTGLYKLKMQLNSSGSVTVRILDLVGREIHNSKFTDRNAESIQLDLRTKPTGIYLLEITIGQEKIVRRLVKE